MERVLPDSAVQYLRDLRDAHDMGYLYCLVETRQISPDISMREAGKLYGPAVVRRWIDEGLIKVRQDGPGCKIRISRIELEEVSRASNRAQFMTVVERQKLKDRKKK